MSLFLFVLSLVFGVIIFVKLIGPDAWLIKGLRGDKVSAVLAFCSIALSGVVIFLLLRFSISLLAGMLNGAAHGSETDLRVDYPRQIDVLNGLVCLMSFCLPILTGYLLSLLYKGIYKVIRHFAVH